MADNRPEALRREAAIRRREAAMARAANEALDKLRAMIEAELRSGGMDPAVLDSRHPAWVAAVEDDLLPEVNEAFLEGLRREARDGTIEATAYSARHLESVHNRLVGVADSVFDNMREELRDAWLEGEDIPTIAKRVDAYLAPGQRWTNRAVVIARTEVVGANNAGAMAAAGHNAGVLGVAEEAVVKEWLATGDSRTRPSHRDASGDTVVGLRAKFQLAGGQLEHPGDPMGPPDEVIQCRCTVLYHYPGDPAYPSSDVPAPVEQPAPVTAADDATVAFQKAAQEHAESKVRYNTAAGKRWYEYQQGAGRGNYREQNKILRGPDNAARRKLAAAWDDAFDTMGTDTAAPVRLFRGTKGSHADEWFRSLEAGTEWADDGVVSTTASPNAARGFLTDFFPDKPAPEDAVLVELRVPAGVRAVGGMSNTFETMLRPGTRMRIVSKERRPSPGSYAGDINYVVAEVIP